MTQRCKLLKWLFCFALAVAVAQPAAASTEGARTVEGLCSQCHTPLQHPIEKLHLTRDEWASAVERMRNYGVMVPNSKMTGLLDYLARTQGPKQKL